MGTLVHCRWECKLVQALSNNTEAPQQIKNRITMRSNNSTSSIKSKDMRLLSWMKSALHVSASLFTIAKTWKQPLSPLIDEWIQKMWCVYTKRDNDILFSHKRKEILLFAIIWMDLEGIMISEISQTEKDKYHMISLTSGIHKNQSWWLLEPRGQRWGNGYSGQRVPISYYNINKFWQYNVQHGDCS